MFLVEKWLGGGC